MPQSETYADEEFINAIESQPQQVAGTGEIRSTVGCTRTTAIERLRILEDAGDVTCDEFGGGYVWQLADT